MARLSTRLLALEARQLAASSAFGIVVYPPDLADDALETWLAARIAALPPGQACMLLPDNGRSWTERDG